MKKASTILKRLKDLEEQRQQVLAKLFKTDELAVGSLSRAKRPCGNARCKQCQQGPSHEQVVFHYTTEKGKQTSRFVRRAEEERFGTASDLYKEFRECLRELKHLETEFRQMCGAFMDARALDPVRRKS